MNKDKFHTKWLIFKKIDFPNRQTDVWRIESIHCILLGYIKWFNKWRCYAFFPEPVTIFNSECMKDIKEFIDKLMQYRKR